ncbi:phosphotransferase family protein [Nocardioides pacificus]
MTQTPPPADMKLRRSARDAEAVPGLLADWLATLLPPGADPAVRIGDGIDANGMSSETLVVDVDWTETDEAGGRERRTHGFVARVAPRQEDYPVFASYRLDHQYDAMRLAGELTEVPVPRVRWLEPTGDVLGTPFFLMDRVDGVVPPDVLPYNFGDNWLFDAGEERQRQVQDATVAVVAQLHAIPDAATTFAFLDPDQPGETPLHRHVARTREWYEFAARDIGPSPLVERGLAWLLRNWPEDRGDTVLCWGDSRIGNVLYDDFTPVGVLDWELAAIGPRELDLGWMVFCHQVFEHITGMLEMPGMPHFLREEDVRATYTDLTGVETGDLTWFHVYAAVQWGVVFMRTGARQVHFGEIEMPDEVDALFHHRGLLERLLDEAGEQ